MQGLENGQKKRISNLRQQLRDQENSFFVDNTEFLRLLISNDRLVRFDQPAAKLRGIRSITNGNRFFIEAERLESERSL
jgi:hypothetical protein